MGRSFTVTCQFLTIVQEVALLYFSQDVTPVSDRVPLSFAEAKYQKLLSWSDTLSGDLAWHENCAAHLIIFHMWFHSAVLDIFRPFLQTEKYHRLISFASKDSSPRAVFSASVNQLKRLAVIYRSKHISTTYMPYVNGSLVHIADTVLKDKTDPNWKYYFMLCIRCWQQLYIGHPIFGDIARASLSMATKNDRITKDEANILLAELQELGYHHRFAQSVITTSIIVDYDLAMTNRDEARVRTLAISFTDTKLFS
ncbi:hypothetical protein PT974_04780 [Cladobotryum mycophilum]|uniref:Uncharacterized protein n=1 Tax=Cladobotryum mycophilum TaxID=491253 RepID=A0ABR0SQW3_9HYPO